ncbi:hypothetical protein [Brevibacillus brevis]|uniref:hypothetical protein n=1 Tax=Brevibacillus brevis TaxID=1393 RepID=UPI000D0FC996|nr:hypothetical protein [Brevibacillus brevis]PSJ71276.1 hypothetical protein C7J99_00220 [Brevibacillus brevis]GEC90309.1 hypothetical protein BBR01nite_26400 [Brevibacillus brevis]
MKSINDLQMNNWLSMELVLKKEWLKSFEDYKGHAFTFKTVESFPSGKLTLATGIYELDGCEFVFVPGGKVRLGWNQLVEQDEFILSAMQSDLEIAGFEQDALDYLSSVFSPVREVEIPPMLVERNVQQVIHADGRLVNFMEVIKEFDQQGFSLLTEDEWEYICGAGTKRIFSEHLDQGLLEDIGMEKRYYYDADLEKPNGFGVYIAYDPYLYELVDSPCYTKGGDGGAAAHGGYYMLGVVPLSPHYRDEGIKELVCSDGNFDCDVYARRVIKIE